MVAFIADVGYPIDYPQYGVSLPTCQLLVAFFALLDL